MKTLKQEVTNLITIQELDRDKLPREYLCGTWLPGLYYGNDWFREIDQDVFFSKYLEVLCALLARPQLRVMAATLNLDPDSIVGFSVYEQRESGNVLHWVYVRKDWRKKGIASNLIPPGVSAVTHLTKVGKAIKPKQWKFNPFL